MCARPDIPRSLTFAALALAMVAANSASAAEPGPAVRALPLPGAPAGGAGVGMDYIAYEPAHRRVWVPAGNTGRVDVVDTASDTITAVEGFPTAEVERDGRKRTVGPSSATVGDGVVYVGNRGDSKVCAIDAASLEKAGCVKLDSMPDGLAYVAATKEVWVTTPRDNAIVILDAAAPKAPAAKGRIALEGQPEGFAVDDGRSLFYTNYEDKDRTLVIDVRARTVTKTWAPQCGPEGPRGLALDKDRNQLLVACTDHLVVMDAGHDGRLGSRIDTGEGVDNIDYVPARHEVYAAAGRAAKLTVARLDPEGKLATVATVTTALGARNAVATPEGVAYVTDSAEGKLLVVGPAAGH